MEKQEQLVKKNNLDYIDYFRAVAIIFIVAGHTLVWGRSTMLEFNTLLFAGGTYFFVFIAGFLFQYLSYKFEIKTYFKKKLINVICPFFVTLLPVALLYTFQNPENWALTKATTGMRLFSVLVGGYIVNGPVWFIGMISIMFLFSPLFLYSWKNKKIHITLLLSSLILCLIVPRYSSINMFLGFNPYESSLLKILWMNIAFYFKCFFKFAFFYLLGMEICEYISNNYAKIRAYLRTIFQISLFLYIFHFIIHLFIIKIDVSGGGRFAELISKFIETFVLLSGLMLAEEKIKNNKFLDKFMKFVAKYSFGIFFIHGYIINYLHNHTLYWVHVGGAHILFTGKNTLKCCLTSFGVFFTVLTTSLLVLWVLKIILNKLGIKNTRMFIGV